MAHRAGPWTAAAAGVLVVVTACGGSSPSVVRPGARTTGPPATSTAPATGTAPGSSGLTSSGPAATQTVAVSPATRLKARQAVAVRGSGFTPGEPLQVIECAAKQQQTGPGDCNLPGMLATVADAAGQVAVRLTVVRGPFGANRIVCSSSQPCLVSVTQASLSPTEEADAPISFLP